MNILIVEDEKAIRESIQIVLSREGFSVESTENGQIALEKISEGLFDLVISDIRLPGLDGIELLRQTRLRSPETLFILITAFPTLDTAIQALREGAVDYIRKPLELRGLIAKVEHLMRYRKLAIENQALRRELEGQYSSESIVGQSVVIRDVLISIERIASTNSTVLITGDSGTGKELVARAVHYSGSRKKNRFIPINCSAIPEELMESELFGYQRGAFTGAAMNREGLFKAADQGTLFLDEISELPLNLQPKLLRAIESKEILPLGSSQPLHVDPRFIAATNRDLGKEVQNGNFREDLYYRINVVQIHIPPLRERCEDIPLLVEHFLRKLNHELSKSVKGVSNETMRVLMDRNWPGNVRELANVLERAMIYCDGDFIEISDLPPGQAIPTQSQQTENLRDSLRQYERQHIMRVLAQVEGDKKEAAQQLGIGVSSLYRKIEELAISAP